LIGAGGDQHCADQGGAHRSREADDGADDEVAAVPGLSSRGAGIERHGHPA